MIDPNYSIALELAKSSPDSTHQRWVVYLLRCSDNTIYTGITTDLARRVRQHNGELSGGARYTAARRPVDVVWCSEYLSRSDAQSREALIRRLDRMGKESLIEKFQSDE